MSEMPRVWWDGNDFLYLLPGPLLGVEGYDNVRRPGLYRARKAADIPAEGVVELAPVSEKAVDARALELSYWFGRLQYTDDLPSLRGLMRARIEELEEQGDAVAYAPVSDAPAAPEETELILDLTRADHPYSRSLLGDWCSMCGDPATHKVGEEDVTRQFHNLTNYLCCLHFTVAIGDCDLFPYGHGQEVTEVDYGKEVADDV